MQLRTYSPDAPLTSLVDCFWCVRGLDGDHAWERGLPTGAMQLVVNVHDDSVVVADDSRTSSRTRLSVACLERDGVEHVFGVPGEGADAEPVPARDLVPLPRATPIPCARPRSSTTAESNFRDGMRKKMQK